MDLHRSSAHGLNPLQKVSLMVMAVLTIMTFVASNIHALLWQHSAWLVSTVLPAVVVELTNDERGEAAIQPLQRNATLDEAARLKAQHMATNEYFSHYSPDGVSPWYWFKEAGYTYAHAGENLAIHFTDSSEVVEAWMKSPTHRANIVNAQYAEIGVGTAKGTYEGFDTVYVVQLFGTPAVSAPVAPIAPVVTTLPVVVTAPVAPPPPVPQPVPETPAPVVAAAETVETVMPETVEAIPPTPSTILVTADDVVVIESSLATSSGLAIASIVESTNEGTRPVLAGVMTKPQQMLMSVYLLLSAMVVGLLLVSAVGEARRFHFIQVAYSVFLLVGMSGLWFVHHYLTSGAVIV